MTKKIDMSIMGVRLRYVIRKNRLFIIAPALMTRAIKNQYETQQKREDSDILKVQLANNVVVVTIRWKKEKEAPETEEEIKECEKGMEENLKKGLKKGGLLK